MKILIVDNEESFRSHLIHLFERKGYEVVGAKDASETLWLAEQHPFDVIFLDIILPDMDGIEVLQNLKEIHPDVQVVMMTGNATIESAITSMKLGAYDYLVTCRGTYLFTARQRDFTQRTSSPEPL